MSHKSKHNIMINQTSKIYFFFLLSLSFVFLCLQVQQLTSKLVNVEKKYISANSKIAQIQNNVLNLDENNRQLQSNTQQIHASIHRNNTVRQKHTDILLRVIVLTMNRAQSLNRLLHSLFDAEYYHDKIALDIWIDLPPFETKINVETRQIVTDFSWPYGPKTLHFRDNNVGLRRQWLESWNYSVSGGLKPDLKECALIVEDDIVVSPLFWKWLKAAHAQYRNHSRIAGFSLQRLDLCAGKCPSHVTHDLPDTANFLYPLVGSWGFSPRLEHWINFTKWTMQYLPDEIREKPYVEDTVPTTWYKSFEKTGKCPGKNCMWTQLHHYYTSFSPDKYTLYYKAAGKKALSHNYREKGLHFGKGVEVPVGNTLIKADDILRIQFPTTPIVLNYNGEVTGSIKGDLEFLHFQHAECQQSLKWLPVMFFNSEFTKFLDNWIYHANLHVPGLHACMLYVALDMHAFEFVLKNYNPNFLYLWNTKQRHEMKFATPDYVKHIEHRFSFMINLLEHNFSIAVLEPDQVLLGDVFKFINKKEEQSVRLHEVITYDDDSQGKKIPCNGFLFLRKTDRVIGIISKIQRKLSQQPISNHIHQNDQHMARTVFSEDKVHVWFLPEDRFIGGHRLKIMPNKLLFENALFVHANYVIGTQQKIDLLKRNGLWFESTSNDKPKSQQKCLDFSVLSKSPQNIFFSQKCTQKTKNECVRLGSQYGGHEFPREFCSLGNDAIVYTFGVGEDISFEIALAAVHDFTIRLFDPTPRAEKHVQTVSQILQKKELTGITKSKSKADEFFFRNETLSISGKVDAMHWLQNTARLSHEISRSFNFRPYALGTADSFVNFFPPKEGVSHSLLSKNDSDSVKALRVQSKKLSSIMKESGDEHITILKIDIEGFEIHVIPELVELFKTWETFRWPRIILFDMDSLRPYHTHYDATRAKECIEMLLDIGYVVFSQDLYDYTFIKARDDIHLGMQKSNKNSEQKNKFSNSVETHYNQKYHQNFQIPLNKFGAIVKGDLLNAFLANLKVHNFPQSVLEFGSASGHIINRIRAHGSKFGVEISEYARNYHVHHFPNVTSLIKLEDAPPGNIDFLYSHSVLEHVECPISKLKEFQALLSKRGLVFLHVKNDGLMQDQFNWRKDDVSKHIYTWNTLLLGNMADAAGLEICAAVSQYEAWWNTDAKIYSNNRREWCLKQLEHGKKISSQSVYLVASLKMSDMCIKAKQALKGVMNCNFL